MKVPRNRACCATKNAADRFRARQGGTTVAAAMPSPTFGFRLRRCPGSSCAGRTDGSLSRCGSLRADGAVVAGPHPEERTHELRFRIELHLEVHGAVVAAQPKNCFAFGVVPERLFE